MATDIKSQFSGAMSPSVRGGAGHMKGAELDGVPGSASLTSINGSPIVTFDTTTSLVPREAVLPTSFETSIRKTGI